MISLLYIGLAAAGFMLYLIFETQKLEGLWTFTKWFITSYASVSYFVLCIVCLRVEESQLLQKLKAWAIPLNALVFFWIIHADLEIPFAGTTWQWIVYSLLAVV